MTNFKYTNKLFPELPKVKRGTYRVKGDIGVNEKLAQAQAVIKKIAEDNNITLLLHCEMQGNGWLLLWWPSNEPRHSVNDQIINGKSDVKEFDIDHNKIDIDYNKVELIFDKNIIEKNKAFLNREDK